MIRKQRRYVTERDTMRDIKNLLNEDNNIDPYESIPTKDKTLSIIGDIIESAREISSLVTYDGASPNKKEISKLFGVLNEMLNVEKKMRKDVGESELMPL